MYGLTKLKKLNAWNFLNFSKNCLKTPQFDNGALYLNCTKILTKIASYIFHQKIKSKSLLSLIEHFFEKDSFSYNYFYTFYFLKKILRGQNKTHEKYLKIALF